MSKLDNNCCYDKGIQRGGILAKVIERIEDDIKALEPRNVKLLLFDVPVYGGHADVRIKRSHCLPSNLMANKTHHINNGKS